MPRLSTDPSDDVLITGWGHSTFGKLVDEDLESLIVAVGAEAIASSGLQPDEIDEIYFGQFNSGLWPLGFASSLALQISDSLGGVASTRVENACASGSAAIHQGLRSIRARTADNVLVIGAEKMTHAAPDVIGRALLGADYESAGAEATSGFASLFARVAEAYESRYGSIADTLGVVAAKSHANAMDNPFAHLRKDLSVSFCQTVSEANPHIAGILRRTDCSPVSDGAAALVLSRRSHESAINQPVKLLGFSQSNDFLPRGKRDPLKFAGSESAWSNAMQMANLRLSDLDFVELHDCFTIAELNLYEVIGLTERGQGARALDEGWVYRGGKLPINPSGGLKSKGHPVGATGVSQHVMAARQLSGVAGSAQLPRARHAAVHNMGGLAVANYVTVLEATY